MKGPHPLYKLHIGFEVDNDGWLAYCQEMPGVSAHGPTREAALVELETAYELAMDVAKESGWKGWGLSGQFPPDITIHRGFESTLGEQTLEDALNWLGLPILNERGQPTRSEIPDLALPVVVAAIQERGWVWRVGQTTFSKSHHQFEAVVSRIVADDVTGDLEVRTSEYDADSPAEALAWALVEAVSATSEEAKA